MAQRSRSRRAFLRVQIPMVVRMSSGDRIFRACRVRDIGLGGLFVEDDHMRKGDRWSVELGPGVDSRTLAVEAWARVVRVEPGQGAALEFTDMTLESFDQLDRLVEKNSRGMQAESV